MNGGSNTHARDDDDDARSRMPKPPYKSEIAVVSQFSVMLLLFETITPHVDFSLSLDVIGRNDKIDEPDW